MTAVSPTVADVTARLIERSAATRADYLARIAAARVAGPARGRLAGLHHMQHVFGHGPALVCRRVAAERSKRHGVADREEPRGGRVRYPSVRQPALEPEHAVCRKEPQDARQWIGLCADLFGHLRHRDRRIADRVRDPQFRRNMQCPRQKMPIIDTMQ